MNGRRSATRTVPLGVLVLFAAVPAASIAAVWRLADAQLPVEDAAPVTSLDVGTRAVADPLATAVLSFRRHPTLVAERVAEARGLAESTRRAEALAGALDDALTGRAGSTACLRVDVDGVPVVDIGAVTDPVPASTQKLLIAAVALDLVGPDVRYRTELRSFPPVGGVVPGDLVLVGGGDPVLHTDAFDDPQRYPAFNTTSLDRLADMVVAAGVTEIDGAVVGDGSRYDDEFRAPSWGDDITNFDAGPYDALLVDDGFLDDGNHGLVPARSAASRFVDLLRERGVAVRDGAANADRTPVDGETSLAFVESEPLADVVVEMLHTSDNNTAEMLLKEVGVRAAGVGTREAGLDAVRARLAEWSVPNDGVVLADGSGLSRANRVGCDALTAILGSTPVSSELVGLLPAAGRDGTLSTQLLDTAAEGRLKGKTGTLTGVKALAGEQPGADGRPIVFAVVMNGDGVEDPSVHLPVWRELVEFIDGFPAEVTVDPEEFAPRTDSDGAAAPRVDP